MTAIKQIGMASVVILAATYLVMPYGVTAVSPQPHVPGNNGTLKVHEKNTPTATENNDPKVCHFNFEGYGFDKGQQGIVIITTQGNGPDSREVARVNLPAANAEGYMASAYLTLPDGHYKTTAYGKDVHGDIDYKIELKAKSKVIKVECDTTTNPHNGGGQGSTGGNNGNNGSNGNTGNTGSGGSTNGTGTSHGGGQGQTSSTSTTTGTVAGASTTTLPTTIASTGTSPLQGVINAVCAAVGIYAALLNRKQQ